MASRDIYAEVRDYYDARLQSCGPTPAGVDWSSAASQELRFAQLLRCWRLTEDVSVLDYGCGYGALLDYLRSSGIEAAYVGFDISSSMVAQAERLHPPSARGVFASSLDALDATDYVVASGIFNVKQAASNGEWLRYVEEEIVRMAQHARVAVAFNILSLYSDPEKRRDYLYYADPRALFDFCKRHIGDAVALLHDYPLYEFTVIVRLRG